LTALTMVASSLRWNGLKSPQPAEAVATAHDAPRTRSRCTLRRTRRVDRKPLLTTSTPQIRQQSRPATHQVGHVLVQQLANLGPHFLVPLPPPRFARTGEVLQRLPRHDRQRAAFTVAWTARRADHAAGTGAKDQL